MKSKIRVVELWHVLAIERLRHDIGMPVYHAPAHFLFSGGEGDAGLMRCRDFWKNYILPHTKARNTRQGRIYRYCFCYEYGAVSLDTRPLRYADHLIAPARPVGEQSAAEQRTDFEKKPRQG